jgi:hypothetical protein
LQIVQDLARRVRARRRHHAAARMRAGTAHVEALGRTAVLREPGKRTIEQQLVERELALEDVAFGESHLVLDDVRSAHFDMTDE